MKFGLASKKVLTLKCGIITVDTGFRKIDIPIYDLKSFV
ncbi:MAG: hypothetical protein PWR06_2005 [Thermoanaerobacteraceae bacterium]|nr:hypothetical protein [Thermoanaerobacteraceae bacterium]